MWNHFLINDRSEPAVETEGALKPLFVCRTSVEMDVVSSCSVSNGSKARFVEWQDPIVRHRVGSSTLSVDVERAASRRSWEVGHPFHPSRLPHVALATDIIVEIVLHQVLISGTLPNCQQTLILHVAEIAQRLAQLIGRTAWIESSFMVHPSLLTEERAGRSWMQFSAVVGSNS